MLAHVHIYMNAPDVLETLKEEVRDRYCVLVN